VFKLYLLGGHVLEAADARITTSADYSGRTVERIPDLFGGMGAAGKTVALVDRAGQVFAYVRTESIVAYEHEDVVAPQPTRPF
jgi:hypothetical protein